jgi:hypothetical protein
MSWSLGRQIRPDNLEMHPGKSPRLADLRKHSRKESSTQQIGAGAYLRPCKDNADSTAAEPSLTIWRCDKSSPLVCVFAPQNKAGRVCFGNLFPVLIGHLTLNIAYVLSTVHNAGLGPQSGLPDGAEEIDA